MGPRPRSHPAGQHAGQRQGGGLQQVRPPAAKRQRGHQSEGGQGIEDHPGLLQQGKPQTDAQGQEYRDPQEQKSQTARGLQGCQGPHHPPHLATPCAIA